MTEPAAPSSRRSPEHEAKSGTRLSAPEIHDNVLSEATDELERASLSLLLSSFASGLAIGFSLLGAAFASSLVPEAYGHAAASAAYPLGFIFVIMARSELFTENTLTPVLPFLHRRDRGTFGKMLRVWAVLLTGNLAGTFIFSWVMSRTPSIPEYLKPFMLEISEKTTSTTFGTTVYQAVFAGWLIALLTWVLASTRQTGAQLVLIWLITAAMSAFEFKHSIVGATEAFYRVWEGGVGWGPMWSFIAAAVIGNTIGGVLLVAILNFGQVVTERKKKHEDAETGEK
ncbi:MAG: formate/nitrite transporter family protein [Gemmatimonadota bacterium]